MGSISSSDETVCVLYASRERASAAATKEADIKRYACRATFRRLQQQQQRASPLSRDLLCADGTANATGARCELHRQIVISFIKIMTEDAIIDKWGGCYRPTAVPILHHVNQCSQSNRLHTPIRC